MSREFMSYRGKFPGFLQPSSRQNAKAKGSPDKNKHPKNSVTLSFKQSNQMMKYRCCHHKTDLHC
jgi:hypothetical protein